MSKEPYPYEAIGQSLSGYTIEQFDFPATYDKLTPLAVGRLSRIKGTLRKWFSVKS